MVEHQRQIGTATPNGCVLEGRDIGSVVFPNADIKFFLTAKPEARARRRFTEDQSKGRISHVTNKPSPRSTNATSATYRARIRRSPSPTDAIVIDTSELDLTEVFEQMLGEDRRTAGCNAPNSLTCRDPLD